MTSKKKQLLVCDVYHTYSKVHQLLVQALGRKIMLTQRRHSQHSPVGPHQWQFWQLGWQSWWLTRHLQPPDVSPRPCENQNRSKFNLLFGRRSNILKEGQVTFGPQRACLVTQQISVLHITQQSQSQPSFFWTMMSQRGHFMASPFCSRFCDAKCGIRERRQNCLAGTVIYTLHTLFFKNTL